MFSLGGITFHWYGLLVGIALVTGWQLVEYRLRNLKHAEVYFKDLERLLPFVVLSGFVGARLWHVVTDWHVYQDNPMAVLYIWRGGLSIIGAVVASILVVVFFCQKKYGEKWKEKTYFYLDAFTFGLPIAQAVGRLGNWVNQELYGLPTTLPWRVYIQPSFRASGFEQFEYFHPLFAYEAVAMIVFGVFVWWSRARPVFQLGKGRLTFCYVLYYCLVRFVLDFLRIDKALVGETGLGVNQVVLMVIFILSAIWFVKSELRKNAE